LAAAVYGDPTARLQVLGVTGTAGKTTVSYLLEAGLQACGVPTGLLGTVVNRFDTANGPVTLDAVRTTPESPDLQALFALMLERGVRAVAMEVSSHALALHRVDGTRFAVAAFTNLGSDHLDFHADTEDYFAAKAKLFDGRARVEVVNVDDPYGRRLLQPRTITTSTAAAATGAGAGTSAAGWTVSDVTPNGTGSTFVAHGPGGLRLATGVRLPGGFNVANALTAIAIGVAAGADPATLAAGVAASPGVPGRMEQVTVGPVAAVVDYAHKPEAVSAVLQALRPVTTGRLLVVLGAGGDRDVGKRAAMGIAVARDADLVVITDDNPRSEDPAAIRAAVLAGARSAGTGTELLEIGDRRAAIRAAAARAVAGDTVAVLGKGHETYQEAAGVRQPFDDRVELATALRNGIGAGADGQGVVTR
jgi:UDP-N-acetylmuramoyl-L-alanyl-D-glutamate--2,6-diaminopimelate ligase